MHDLDMHAALLADRDCLGDRLDHFVGFVAQVGEIAGVVALEHMAERDHFRSCRVGAGRREQARRHAERAGIERVFKERDHLLELGRARRALRHAHHHQAQRVVADQHAGIHRGRRKRVQIIRETGFAKRQPRRAWAQIIFQQLDLAGQRRRDRKAAMADDLGGDALAHLAFGLRIDRQREIRMRLDVDKTRRDGEPFGVDDFVRGVGDARPIAAMRPPAMARSPATPGLPAPSIQNSAADQDVVQGDFYVRSGVCDA